MPSFSMFWLYMKYSELVTARRMEGKLSSRLGTEHLKVRIRSVRQQHSVGDPVASSLVLLFSLTPVGLCQFLVFRSCQVRIVGQDQPTSQTCCEH